MVFLKKGSQRNLKSQEAEEVQFIVEFETDDTLSNLKEKLSSISLVSLEQNGGTFVAHFPMHTTVDIFLETVLKEKFSWYTSVILLIQPVVSLLNNSHAR